MLWRVVSGMALGFLVVAAAGQLAVGWPDDDKGKKKKDKHKSDDKKHGPSNTDPSKLDGVVTNWGRPKEFAPGKVNAFWLWYEDDLWHLRTTGGGVGAHDFRGVVEVLGGRLSELKGKAGEYRGKLVDRYLYNAARTRIDFDFRTDQGMDGLNFAVDNPAATVRLQFALDGHEQPLHTRIGKNGDHPPRYVFVVPARPVNTGKK